MKKSPVSYLSILVISIFLSWHVSVSLASAATSGLESAQIYSETVLIPGCASEYGFSIVNGLPCSAGTFSSSVTGITNDKPALIPGCAGSYGFSVYNGQPCANRAETSYTFIPGTGVSLGGWKGWTEPAQIVTSVRIYFARPLDLGSRGEDVRLLQSFLAKDKSLYPEAYINGYFGMNTARAVGKLQLKYGLVKSADESTYGYVGPKTRALLNSLQ